MVLGFVGGCLRRLFVLAVLGVAVAAAWSQRDRLGAAWTEVWADVRVLLPFRAPAEPSPELAETAERKLEALIRPTPPDRIALSEVEVQSLVRYRIGALVPEALDSPRVRLRDGRVHFDARVATRRLPAIEDLRQVMSFLPDTAQVGAVAQVIPHDATRAALQFNEITAARIPLPRPLIPRVLEALGRYEDPALPDNAFIVPLPRGARAAYVSGDSLVFLARTGAAGARADGPGM